jgi:aspartate/methionine/tyrosine aminotransferase
MADYLLEKGLVIAVPGASFGDPGEGHLRFSFAASM